MRIRPVLGALLAPVLALVLAAPATAGLPGAKITDQDPVSGVVNDLAQTVDAVSQTLTGVVGVDDAVGLVQNAVGEVKKAAKEKKKPGGQGAPELGLDRGPTGSDDGTQTSGEAGDPGPAAAGSPKAAPRGTGGTARTKLPAPPTLSVGVTKTNDADRDGIFSDTETAPATEASVPFKVVIANSGMARATIISIADLIGDSSSRIVSVCQELVGEELAPGGTTTCEFTLDDYSPPGGIRLANRLRVQVVDTEDPSRDAIGTDVSSVGTSRAAQGEVSVLGEVVGPGSDAGSPLATTGARVVPLLRIALLLALTGAVLLYLGSRRTRRPARVRPRRRVPVISLSAPTAHRATTGFVLERVRAV